MPEYTLNRGDEMEEKIKEVYAKEGKSLTELIQEWIFENSSILYCIIDKKEIKYQGR